MDPQRHELVDPAISQSLHLVAQSVTRAEADNVKAAIAVGSLAAMLASRAAFDQGSREREELINQVRQQRPAS